MNNAIFFFFYNLSHNSKIFDQIVFFVADIFPYIVILLAFLFLIFYLPLPTSPLGGGKRMGFIFIPKWKEITLVFFSGVLAWVLAYILKIIIHTPRPLEMFSNIVPLFSESGYALPSGHATFFMALALALFFNHKKAGYVFILFALLIGVARIIAGVHFPIDILGGFVLGFVIAFFIKNV